MTDKALREKVVAALDREAKLGGADIGVEVDQGVVTLTGRLAHADLRIDAERAVKRVHGVKGLVMRIELGGEPDNGDEALAFRVLDSLASVRHLPKNAIQVEVKDGVVTLTGEVLDRGQRDIAAAAVLRIVKAGRFANLIMVKPRPTVTDIQRRIEAALKQDAERDVDAISVEVHGDKVVLTGKVRDSRERETVKKAVAASPGVATVEDKLDGG